MTMTQSPGFVCDVTNAELLDEIKLIRQEMKDLHWRLLLKFTEQVEELQTEIRHLRKNSSNVSVCDEVVESTEDINIYEEASCAWPDASQRTPISFNEQRGPNGDESEMNAAPVVLEVTTSQISDNFPVINEHTDLNMSMLNEQDETLSPFNYVSKHLYNESTHIANCKDRHCMLCKSLQVVNPKQHIDEQKSQWKCGVCLRYFRRKYNLKNHMRCHTGEKPFQCKVCKHYFRSKQALNYHAHKHDPNYQSQSLSEQVKFCKENEEVKNDTESETELSPADAGSDVEEWAEQGNNSTMEQTNTAACAKNQTESLLAKLTSKRVAGPDGLWKCPICGKFFQRKANVKNHMRIHTGDKPYKCDVCQRSFAAPYSLKIHQKTHTIDV